MAQNIRNQIPKTIQSQVTELIKKSKFSLTSQEREHLVYYDYGSGNFLQEGVVFVDVLNTKRLRITLLILLPGQTLPQHRHPPYASEKGKEETLRVLYGQTKIYIDDIQNVSNVQVPAGKVPFYTAQHEICLAEGQQFTVFPNQLHWFQSGNEGSVNLEFQNSVDESQNVFTDPNISFSKNKIILTNSTV